MAAAPKPDRFDALEAYVAELQEALAITVWKITVIREASDVEAWADINPHEQAESAELRVSYDFWKQTPDHQREVLIHEMLHSLGLGEGPPSSLEITRGVLARCG